MGCVVTSDGVGCVVTSDGVGCVVTSKGGLVSTTSHDRPTRHAAYRDRTHVLMCAPLTPLRSVSVIL